MFSFQLLCLFFAPIRPPVIANANAVYSLGGKEMKNLYRTKRVGLKLWVQLEVVLLINELQGEHGGGGATRFCPMNSTIN